MRSWKTAVILAVAVSPCFSSPLLPLAQAAMVAPATRPATAALPVTKVQLFSSGVGYFEHSGVVSGDGSTELRFTTEQINDILKSLVLQDLDGGKVSAVTYPSNDPLAKTLKSFAIDLTKNPSLAELLNQLRGASVTVDADDGQLRGIVLGVENHTRTLAGPPAATEIESSLKLLSGATIVNKQLAQIRSVALDDPHLQDELNKALAAVAGARNQDKKPVTIVFSGVGDRRVRIGYVVQTPVWKTSYRLLLDDAGGGVPALRAPGTADGNLQGWAIVENQTDNDWTDIQLSLVSGRPVSFVQDLYQPQYLERPVVGAQQDESVQPQMYAGGMVNMDQAKASAAAPVGGGFRSFHSHTGQNALADQSIDARMSIKSMAAASAIGELFQYTVDHVSLPRQQSSMIPIITDPIQVQRVSIFNSDVSVNHPLNGARITNNTSKHLLAGPMTVLDGGVYAGDAQIDNVSPGQKRLLSYAIDLQTIVDASQRQSAEHVQTAKIVKGVLILTQKLVRSQDYTIDNQADKPKTIVVEHPRESAWSLVDTAAPSELTPQVYRFDVDVAAGKRAMLKVSEQRIQDQWIEVMSTDSDTLEQYRRGGEIPPKVLDALAKAVSLKQATVDTQRLIDRDKAELADITAEQSRLRDNLKAVQPSSKYYERVMTKLNDQETQIEGIQGDQTAMEKKLAGQQGELADYVNGLNVG